MTTEVSSRAFVDVCARIRGLLAEAIRNEVVSRHSVGELVNGVVRSADRYGDHAVERIGAELGVSTTILYGAASVAENWSQSELRHLCAKTNYRGEPLSWSHFLALTRVRSAVKRRALAEQCLAEAWAVRELRQQVADLQPAGRERADGSSDESLRVAVDEGVRTARRAAADIGTFLEALEARLSDGDHEELLSRALAACDELNERLQATRTFLSQTTRSSAPRVRIAVRTRVPEDDPSERERSGEGVARVRR